jgi:hypothetical protein
MFLSPLKGAKDLGDWLWLLMFFNLIFLYRLKKAPRVRYSREGKMKN